MKSKSVWMELILEIVKAHSGQFVFKKGDKAKPPQPLPYT